MALKSNWNIGESYTATAANDVANTVNDLAARTFYVDDYGADPTGVSFSDTAVAAALTAMGTSPGIIEFGAGTYKLNTTKTLSRPGQGIRGQGSGVTTLDYRGTGDCLRVWDSTVPTTGLTSPGAAGPITGFKIEGGNNSNTSIAGLHIGDLMYIYIQDVHIHAFSTTGSKSFWGENRYSWSERAYIHMTVDKGTDCYLFEKNASHPNSKTSWDYSWFDLSAVTAANQNGFTLKNNVDMVGVDISLYGNCNGATTNTGVFFTVGTTASDISVIRGRLHISAETSGSSGLGPQDFNIGAAAYVTAHAFIRFKDLTPTFQAGTASRFTSAIFGHVSCPSLGKMESSNQAFRTTGVVANRAGTITTASSTHTFFLDHGNIFFKQLLNGANTVAFNIHANLSTTPSQAATYTLLLQQPSSGAAATVTWPGTVVWAAGSAPTLKSANSARDVVQFHTTDHATFFGVLLT